MKKDIPHRFYRPSARILAVFLLLAVCFSMVAPARAAVVFIVDDPGDDPDANTADDICATAGAVCTLRAAIMQANETVGADTIAFDLASAPYVITTTSGALPVITETLFIDGTTQTGYAGVPLIQLDGGSNGWDGLQLAADNSKVYALVIRDFNGAGIAITATGGGVVLFGNYIGTDDTGAAAAGNGVGVRITDSPLNAIGGPASGQGNVISGNSGEGLVIEGAASDGNKVYRNYIGLTSAGNAALPNGADGILIDGALNSTIGGAFLTQRINIISGNTGSGVRIINAASGTKVIGNRIGTNLGDSLDLGNGSYGILVASSGATVGGTDVGTGNIIAYNALDGVAVVSSAAQVAILRNNMHDNGGLGIDLADDGLTANDLGDADSGENNLQNFPVISSAQKSGSTLNLIGGFNSLPSKSYRLEFFASSVCDPSGNGESERFLKDLKITTDGLGNYSLNTSFTATITAGEYITATATFLAGGTTPQDTSEFSTCWIVSTAPTATPTKTPTKTATSTGSGGGGSVYTPTSSRTPTPTITGTPPTNTPVPTWTSNPPQKTLTALASLFAPSQTPTFSPFIFTNTPFPTVTFNAGPFVTPSPTPTRGNFLTAGEMTSTAEAEGSFGQIGGFNLSTLAIWCVVIPLVLLLLGIGGIQLMRWINTRREESGGEA